MSVHDWTRVEAGIFHDFHNSWITELRNHLNDGVLPPDYYALGEQHAGRFVADVLTLHRGKLDEEGRPVVPPLEGGLALAEAPPKAGRQLTGKETYRQRRRTLAVRHVSGHRLVAMIEIVSPANKDRRASVEELVIKTTEALELGVHVMLVDLLPPTRHDPRGVHGAIWDEFDDEPYDFSLAKPLTLASYYAGPPVKAWVEHVAVGGALPEMPLFLHLDRYINVPLDPAYVAAYRGVPAYWRRVLEGQGGSSN